MGVDSEVCHPQTKRYCHPVLKQLIVGWIPVVHTSTGRWMILDYPSNDQQEDGKQAKRLGLETYLPQTSMLSNPGLLISDDAYQKFTQILPLGTNFSMGEPKCHKTTCVGSEFWLAVGCESTVS